MSETSKRRRRWPWWMLGVVLLSLAGPIAWRLRPLNATERSLVGSWKGVESGTDYWFGPDRRFRMQFAAAGVGTPPTQGRWTASRSEVRVRARTPSYGLLIFGRYRLPPVLPSFGASQTAGIRLGEGEEADRLCMGGVEFARISDADSPVADRSPFP